MTFPSKPYSSIAAFYESYAGQITQALASVPKSALAAAEILLAGALDSDAHVYACGNGGSAAISNHLVCDHVKGIQTDTCLRPRVHSLSATIEMITAIANDLDYGEVFAYQLKSFARPGDVLITISSSGDSENVVRAVQWARDNGVRTIALTGFTGGRTAKWVGRIGDSPVIGAGTWADGTCAVSCTGDGECFIRIAAAHDVAARMAYLGETVQQASDHVIHGALAGMGSTGGMVVVDAAGNVAMPFHCEGMYRAMVDGRGNRMVAIYRD